MKITAIIALFAAFVLVSTPLWTTGARAEIMDESPTADDAEIFALVPTQDGGWKRVDLEYDNYEIHGLEFAEGIIVMKLPLGGKVQSWWGHCDAASGIPFPGLVSVTCDEGWPVQDGVLSDGIIHLDLLESGGWMKIMTFRWPIQDVYTITGEDGSEGADNYDLSFGGGDIGAFLTDIAIVYGGIPFPGLVSLTGGIPFPGITSVAGGIPFPGLVSVTVSKDGIVAASIIDLEHVFVGAGPISVVYGGIPFPGLVSVTCDEGWPVQDGVLSDGIIHLDLLESGGWMKIMKSVGYRDDMMKDYDGGDDTIYASPSTSEIHGLEFADYVLVIIFGEDGFVTNHMDNNTHFQIILTIIQDSYPEGLGLKQFTFDGCHCDDREFQLDSHGYVLTIYTGGRYYPVN